MASWRRGSTRMAVAGVVVSVVVGCQSSAVGTLSAPSTAPSVAEATTSTAASADTGGSFGLDSTDAPGDVIEFFRKPRATTETGDLILSVEVSVDAIQKWLAGNAGIQVSPATKISIGGLDGVWMDLAIAPKAGTAGDCPTQACLSMFKGTDGKTWAWDWGTATAERQRVYLLKATDTVVAIFVDSLDGTTFDALTQTADALLATVKFDKP